jgi:hypothetical protein
MRNLVTRLVLHKIDDASLQQLKPELEMCCENDEGVSPAPLKSIQDGGQLLSPPTTAGSMNTDEK